MRQFFKKAIDRFPESEDNCHAEGAPKDHDGNRRPSCDIHGPGGIVPGAGPEQRFFQKGKEYFDEAAENCAAEKDLPIFADMPQKYYNDKRTEAIDGVKGSKQTSAAVDELDRIPVCDLEKHIENDLPQSAEGTSEHIEESGLCESEFSKIGHSKL